jgi:hypothetical protein
MLALFSPWITRVYYAEKYVTMPVFSFLLMEKITPCGNVTRRCIAKPLYTVIALIDNIKTYH